VCEDRAVETEIVAVAAAVIGAGLTKLFDYYRSEKTDRERWENNLRSTYGVFLNHLYDYPRAHDGNEWLDSYKHAHAATVLSATPAVAEFLVKPPLDYPPEPTAGAHLLSEAEYGLLVAAMRRDVAPTLRRRVGGRAAPPPDA
jgi:hypothetical protein